MRYRRCNGRTYALGQQLVIVNAGTARDIELAFASVVEQGAAALVVQAEPYLLSQTEPVGGALAARYAIPTMFFDRAIAEVGGLISYGCDFTYANWQAGIYTGRILKGEKPADLPVMQSTEFELVMKPRPPRRSASKSPMMLSLADVVIE